MDIKKSAIIILAILILGVGGYLILKNLSKPEAQPSPPLSSAPEEEISLEGERDNQRINDIMSISRALEDYAAHNVKAEGPYPKTDGFEKISDESSEVFKKLNQDGYLKRILKDPLPDRYYYGYRSDGKAYELTAVLENKESGKCIQTGNYCVYSFKKGEIGVTPTPAPAPEEEPMGK